MICTTGVIHFGFTAIIEPIANDFGWSYTQISFAASIRGLETGLLAPLIGILVDRWGPRKLIFGGVILTALSLILLSQISSLATFYGVFILMSVATSMNAHTVMTKVVANWFRKRMSLAIGIMAAGFGLGGFIIPIVVRLIDIFDWRATMFILGLAMLVIVLPLSFLVRDKPARYDYLYESEVQGTLVASDSLILARSSNVEIGVKQILKSRTFWQLSLALTLFSLLSNAMITHIMPYLSSIGVARSTASFVAVVIPLISIFGRFSFGWLGDRLDKGRLAAAGFALMSVGLIFLGYAANGSYWFLILSLVLFGLGWGGLIPMRAILLGDQFGRKRIGTVLGLVIGVTHLGNIVGPPLAGWVFDTWGSYQGIWFIFAGLSAIAIAIILATPRFRNEIELAK
ncbi:MFS transporter [Chloroflexota bacterium]